MKSRGILVDIICILTAAMLDLDIDEMVVYSKDGGAPGWRDGPAEKKKS